MLNHSSVTPARARRRRTRRCATGLALLLTMACGAAMAAAPSDSHGSESTGGSMLWATYFGGSEWDGPQEPAVDAGGNIAFQLTTTSDDIPTRNAYDSQRNPGGSGLDAFVAKFSASGEYLWGTYLGGSGSEYGHVAAFDQDGNVYAMGITNSDDFPTPGGAYTARPGQYDVYLTKFSPSGAVLWSTYLGGSVSENNQAGLFGDYIATDDDRNVYLVGSTNSPDFPIVGGPYATHAGGDTDVFLVKFSASGTHLWSTYLGGNGDDYPYGLCVDDAGNLGAVGSTSSSDFPTSGSVDTALNGPDDAFVTVFSASGALRWSSYLGGDSTSGGEQASGALFDSEANVYVTGTTRSADFPIVGWGPRSLYGESDVFFAKFGPSGALLRSTLIGAEGEDFQATLSRGANQSVWLSGHTVMPEFPVPGTGIPPPEYVPFVFEHSRLTTFLAKYNADGELVYAGSGLGLPAPTAGRAHGDDWYYRVWYVEESGLPTPGGEFGSYSGGIYDGYIARFTQPDNELPHVLEAVYNDSDDDGVVEAGESVTLVMSKGVVATTDTLTVSDFFVPVAGDSLGGAGFGVAMNPNNSRHVVLTLGAGASLTLPGSFDIGTTTTGSPSGIDLGAAMPSGAIRGLYGLPAIDGGEPRVDDAAKDVFFTCIASSTTVGAAGGTAQVAVNPNAAYTQHALTIPAGALAGDETFTLRPPAENAGVIGAVQIESSASGGSGSPPALCSAPAAHSPAETLDAATTFALPVTLTLEYRESDIDREAGQVEGAMKIHQLTRTTSGTLVWRVLPVEHDVDRDNNTVSADIANLNPLESNVVPIVMAVLPGSTIEPTIVNVKPSSGGSATIRMPAPRAGGLGISPEEPSTYLEHRVEIPDYEVTTDVDPARISVRLLPATLAQRCTVTGTGFPFQSNAIFAVQTQNASGDPIAFTDPVNVRVQYMDGSQNDYNDLVTFLGDEANRGDMRVVYDAVDGEGVDFTFTYGTGQALDVGTGTIEVQGITNLTGPSGTGVWGTVGLPENPDAAQAEGNWVLYD
ncbi:SBBP repeat-containing protein [Candidatus Sumerlaeota bacterium]|nr:SBBP repeat-containing protein [Candidatus Sumerlaeota bacterium]